MVYCISCDDLWEYLAEKGGNEAIVEDTDFNGVSDDDYKAACNAYGWKLTLDEFVVEFNNDGNGCPTSSYHYIRIF